MNNIVYEDNHLLVVEKPRNVLVQADNTNDLDLLSELKMYIKKKYNKPNNVYLGLVHRLDRPVGGLMVFARTSKVAGRLSNQIRNHQFKKTYLAIGCGYLKSKSGLMEDNLLKLDNQNKTVVNQKGKHAVLQYEVLKEIDGLSLIKIYLETGRSHQIRVQFSHRGCPLWGDQKYNVKAKVGEQIALWSYEINFKHPTTNEEMDFKLEPKWDEYPWNIFK